VNGEIKIKCSGLYVFLLLNKFASLLPNYWLGETPKALALMRLGIQSAERERSSEINWNRIVEECCLPFIQQLGQMMKKEFWNDCRICRTKMVEVY
jgi:hypothetical protein